MKKSKGTLILAIAAFVSLACPRDAYSDRIVVEKDDAAAVPQAIVLKVHGACGYSSGRGGGFRRLRSNHTLFQNAVVRTGKNGSVDLFLRRVGTSVRLQPGTEMVLEQMSRSTAGGLPQTETLLHVLSGRIYIVTGPPLAGNTVEIRNAAGRSVVEGGVGRYVVTADGSQFSENGSIVPPNTAGASGITPIFPGRVYPTREDELRPFEYSEEVQTMMQFDRVQDMGEQYERDRAKRDGARFR